MSHSEKVDGFHDKYGSYMYSLFDRVGEEFSPPFVAANDAVAKRQFNQLMDTQKLNGDDFRLFKVGFWDRITGQIYPIDSEVGLKREEVLS